MTAWDVLNEIMKVFPPVAAGLFLLTAGVILAVGFTQYGVDFIKHGFKQKGISDLGAKIDGLDSRLTEKISGLRDEFKADLGKLDTKIEAIEVNHFGHLKDFLTELTSILLDKGVINNQDKARLDNQLRGM